MMVGEGPILEEEGGYVRCQEGGSRIDVMVVK